MSGSGFIVVWKEPAAGMCGYAPEHGRPPGMPLPKTHCQRAARYKYTSSEKRSSTFIYCAMHGAVLERHAIKPQTFLQLIEVA